MMTPLLVCSLNSNELLLYRLPGVVVCYLLVSRAPDGALHLWEKQDGGGRRMGRAFFRPWLTVIDFLLSENGKRSSCFFFAAETLNVRSVGTCEFCFLKKNFRVKFIFFLKKKPTERYCAVRLICGVFIFTSEMQRLFWGLFCYANSVASIRIVGRPYLRGRRRRRDPERVGTVSPAAEKGRRLPGHENKWFTAHQTFSWLRVAASLIGICLKSPQLAQSRVLIGKNKMASVKPTASWCRRFLRGFTVSINDPHSGSCIRRHFAVE